jgi:hypothetical protein
MDKESKARCAVRRLIAPHFETTEIRRFWSHDGGSDSESESGKQHQPKQIADGKPKLGRPKVETKSRKSRENIQFLPSTAARIRTFEIENGGLSHDEALTLIMDTVDSLKKFQSSKPR